MFLERIFDSDSSHIDKFKIKKNFSLLEGFISSGATSGGTITGSLFVSGSITGSSGYFTTLSAGTIYSGSTNLYSIFAPIGSGGGTTFTGGTVAGFSTFQSGLETISISATTFYSGSTELGSLFNSRHGNILYVSTLGTTSGQKGNVLKTFPIDSVMNYATSGDTVYVLPGVYDLTTQFGLPLKNGVNYYFDDVIFNSTVSNYGSIVPTVTGLSCKIRGKAVFNNNLVSATQGIIGGWSTCNVNVEGCDFYSNTSLFATSINTDVSGIRYYKFKNCRFFSADNNNNPSAGNGTSSRWAQYELENCYVQGLIMMRIDASISQPWNFKATNTIFKAISGNTNGVTSSICMVSFDTSVNRPISFYNCIFISANENIRATQGGGPNARLIIYDSKFINGSEGWLISTWNTDGGGLDFKLINNFTTNNGTGADFPITNLITADMGMFTDSELEYLE